MRITRRFADWLERRWVAPSYSGWLLSGLSVFFFIAATNTLAGWLYVISGIGIALLAIAAFLSSRTLHHLQLRRAPIHPVSAGDHLTLELIVENRSSQPKTLLQVFDALPERLGGTVKTAIEAIPPQRSHHWIYACATTRRGIYRWETLQLRTANPLGLFWCRRSHALTARAIVYPTVLPLVQCPLIDFMGQDDSVLLNSDRRAQSANEGLTRSMRPYRWGDPTRLVHWRSSARYGELRVRELELFTGGQELVIALDSGALWRSLPPDPAMPLSTSLPSEAFEQAVIAAASLYFYAHQRSLRVKLWTAATGLIQGQQAVLEALAATQSGEVGTASLPTQPMLWLSQNPHSLALLPRGSRWLLWEGDELISAPDPSGRRSPGVVVRSQSPLQLQLQQHPSGE